MKFNIRLSIICIIIYVGIKMGRSLIFIFMNIYCIRSNLLYVFCLFLYIYEKFNVLFCIVKFLIEIKYLVFVYFLKLLVMIYYFVWVYCFGFLYSFGKFLVSFLKIFDKKLLLFFIWIEKCLVIYYIFRYYWIRRKYF